TPTDGWSVFDTSRPERTQLTVMNDLERIRVDPAIIRDSQTPAVLRQRFGNGSDPEAMFRMGPIPELVGRTVQSLPQSTDSPVEIQLLRYGDEVSDALNATRPCYYEGTVLSPKSADEPVVLAIAINGTIRAVTRTTSQMGIWGRWSALVPESAFHAGRNDIQFLVVNGPDWRLTPCIASGPTD
ncbi:MAG: hypothetical protein IAG10_00800, partial [Planctomycetaceae bacterium]|nr:hypothetical protein [Planctomycetaceae bacterium]